MNKVETELVLKINPRPQESIFMQIPTDVLNSLQQVAMSRDMSVEALIKFYMGQGLREDLADQFHRNL